MDLKKFAAERCQAMRRFLEEEGWSNEKVVNKVDHHEAEMGQTIEREHSKDPKVRGKIVADHLSEAEIKPGGVSRYYSMLKPGERFVKAISRLPREKQDQAIAALNAFVGRYAKGSRS
ncbi:MAG: hypothetical protein ABFE07_28710 [Armatimonadia bacterium]